MTTVIETQALTKIFAQKKIAVNDLYLSVPKNSIYGFLGPNGAGKTTTIKMLLGLIKPSAGSIKIFNQPMRMDSVALRKRVGYLPTHPTYPDKMTPIKYLDFVGKIFGIPREKRIPRISELIRSTDMLALSSSEIRKFSTGETTRLGIASCLMNNPELLMMDEPTTGLDPIGRASAISLITELGKDPSKTIFISSHILADIERFCTHVGIVSNGKLIFNGTISEVKKLTNANSIILELEGDIPTFTQFLQTVPNVSKYEVTPGAIRVSLRDLTYYKNTVLQLFQYIADNPYQLISFKSGSENLEDAFLQLLEEEKSNGFLRGITRAL
ncbi:MAG: ABC transporter ATP-binding protein [Promethearchaeota archaeon]